MQQVTTHDTPAACEEVADSTHLCALEEVEEVEEVEKEEEEEEDEEEEDEEEDDQRGVGGEDDVNDHHNDKLWWRLMRLAMSRCLDEEVDMCPKVQNDGFRRA